MKRNNTNHIPNYSFGAHVFFLKHMETETMDYVRAMEKR